MKFEYLVYDGGYEGHAARDVNSVLNIYGEEGWELVGFQQTGFRYTVRYIFKRQCETANDLNSLMK